MASLALQSATAALSNLSLASSAAQKQNTTLRAKAPCLSLSYSSLRSSSFIQCSQRLSSSSCFAETLAGTRSRPPAAGRSSTVSVVAAAAEKKKAKKKVDSAVKRAIQAEKHRIWNKSRKSEIATRMKKVIVALNAIKASKEPKEEDIIPVEKLIGEAYKIVDKSIKVGTIHKNTGARRKSRLARYKQRVMISLGWYTPSPPSPAEPAAESLAASA